MTRARRWTWPKPRGGGPAFVVRGGPPRSERTRIVEMPLDGGKARRYIECYFLGRNALPMMSASKYPDSPVIAYR